MYKIGITENPIERWMKKSYGYKCDPYDDWEQMVILYVGADSMHCALVEAHLIHRFCGRSGCRNVNPGGNLLSQALVLSLLMWCGKAWRIQRKHESI